MATRIVVYRYAVHGDLPEAATAELDRAHQLQTRLVEIERAHGEQVAAVWAAQPQLAAADQRIQECTARVAELTREAAGERERTRRRRVAPATTQALGDARAALRQARTDRRQLQEQLYPIVKPQMTQAAAARKAAIKATYRTAIDGGLYWATYNEVLGQHRTTVARVMARRKQGQPSELRLRRFAGSGTIAVQLPREQDDPPRTPELLASGTGRWRNIARLTPWWPPEAWQRLSLGEQRRLARGSFWFRVGSGDLRTGAGTAQLVEVPVIIHRPLPPEADIAMVRITREQVAGHFRAWISVVARVPAPPVRVTGPTVRVHLGWRSLPDGALRVAVAAGVSAPPEELAEVARHHGSWYEIVLPASWRAVAGQLDAIRSRRGVELERLRSWLVAWTSAHPAPTPHGVLPLPDELRRWRSPGRFAALALRLRWKTRGQVAEVAERLEAWRRWDRRLWEREANERRQLLARRNDAWRRVAAWLTDQAGQVLVDGWALTPLRAVPDIVAPDDLQAQAARANAGLAAPGTLRSAIENAAQARGVPVSAPTLAAAATHHVCGSPLTAADRMASALVRCRHCHVEVDQDYNALCHLLAAADQAMPG
jgi:hypothetical protein